MLFAMDLYQKVRQVTAEGFVSLQAEIRRMARLDPGIEKDALLQNFFSHSKGWFSGRIENAIGLFVTTNFILTWNNYPS